MVLKPQDVYVTLKIVAANSRRAPYAELAGELGMSPSEVHASVKRAQFAHLLHGPELANRPNSAALEEFLIHGLKYSFPARTWRAHPWGIPTSYAAEPLRSVIAQNRDPPPVWAFAAGTERGMAFEPLPKSAASAALRDSALYEYLALADALRDGRSRERKYAKEELHCRLGKVNARSES